MNRGNYRLNYRASPIDLYDMIDPGTPAHLNVKFAIYCHRVGDRKPVAFHSATTESEHR